MTARDYLQILQRDIHSTVCATVDGEGLPHTCVIDMMLSDESGLYFLTARGKSFYRRLTANPYVAVSGMKGSGTLSTLAVSVRGAVKNIGREKLDEIFHENPYMAKIYPSEESHRALEVFHLYRGEGEYFDLSQLPPLREAFSFGGQQTSGSGYRIDPQRCIGCGACREICPVGCIADALPRAIDPSHCIHCGNCAEVCPVRAVERLG